jgi:hypothetical protein
VTVTQASTPAMRRAARRAESGAAAVAASGVRAGDGVRRCVIGIGDPVVPTACAMSRAVYDLRHTTNAE